MNETKHDPDNYVPGVQPEETMGSDSEEIHPEVISALNKELNKEQEQQEERRVISSIETELIGIQAATEDEKTILDKISPANTLPHYMGTVMEGEGLDGKGTQAYLEEVRRYQGQLKEGLRFNIKVTQYNDGRVESSVTEKRII